LILMVLYHYIFHSFQSFLFNVRCARCQNLYTFPAIPDKF
jgi:hypothetical protein